MQTPRYHKKIRPEMQFKYNPVPFVLYYGYYACGALTAGAGAAVVGTGALKPA